MEAILVLVQALVSGLAGLLAGIWKRKLRERRDGQAAAFVVLAALRQALDETHETHLHPVRHVVVPFASYADVWKAERNALARRMSQEEEYQTVDSAFARLAALQKAEELGQDLREEVFDDLWETATQCEQARRIVWRHTQSFRDRAQRWLLKQASRGKQRWEFWELGRAVVKARRNRSASLAAGASG